MKTILVKTRNILLGLAFAMLFSSCATVFGGPVGSCQRTQPQPGEPSRQIRAVPFILDLFFFWPGLALDFATGAIYVPCENQPGATPIKEKPKSIYDE